LTISTPTLAGLLSAPVSDRVVDWERALVARLESGDDSALAVVYDQFAALVFGVATRMVGRDHAADVTQEVFAALWDRPERFDHTRGTLRTFLVVLTRRRCIDLLRRTGRRVANEQRAHTGAPVAVPNVVKR
jgi:RNA polymerase sigma-70 factor (ECF subfamily)